MIWNLTDDERNALQGAILSELDEQYGKDDTQSFMSVIMEDPFPVQVWKIISIALDHIETGATKGLDIAACAEGIVMLHDIHINNLQVENEKLREIIEHLNP